MFRFLPQTEKTMRTGIVLIGVLSLLAVFAVQADAPIAELAEE